MKKILLGCPQCKKEALKDKCHHQLCWPDMSKYCETSLDDDSYGELCLRYEEGDDKDYCFADLSQPIPLCPHCETEIKEIQEDINKGIGKCPHCSKHIKFSECSCDDNSDSEQSPDDDSWSYGFYNFSDLACECIVTLPEYLAEKELIEEIRNEEIVHDLEEGFWD